MQAKKNTKTTSLGMVRNHHHIGLMVISHMGDTVVMTKNQLKEISRRPNTWKTEEERPMERRKKMMEVMAINLLAISTVIDNQSGS